MFIVFIYSLHTMNQKFTGITWSYLQWIETQSNILDF